MFVMSNDILIEAFLFYKGGAVSKNALAKAVGLDTTSLHESLDTLRQRLDKTALTLVETTTEVQLTTTPAVHSFLDAVRKDEIKTDIGKAGAETLAIVLYKEPVSRVEIDQIRGVNSALTIRNLMTRGLIARSGQKTAQGYRYTITPELLAHLGVRKKQDLPDYGSILDKIETFTEQEADKTTAV